MSLLSVSIVITIDIAIYGPLHSQHVIVYAIKLLENSMVYANYYCLCNRIIRKLYGLCKLLQCHVLLICLGFDMIEKMVAEQITSFYLDISQLDRYIFVSKLLLCIGAQITLNVCNSPRILDIPMKSEKVTRNNQKAIKKSILVYENK